MRLTWAKLAGIAETTAKRYIRRLTGLGIILHEKDLYWIGNPVAGGAQPFPGPINPVKPRKTLGPIAYNTWTLDP